MKKLPLFLVLSIMLTACSSELSANTTLQKPITTPMTSSCPTDLKRCPDGSLVERSGPNCGFAPCADTPRPSFSASEKQLTTEDAVKLVSQQPEVKAWLALFTGPGRTSPTTGGQAVIEEDGVNGDEDTIHVYEITSDHTTTLNWYHVNMKTGAIRKEFSF